MAQIEKIAFQHYILTRFNLPLSSGKTQNGADVCGAEYLSYRFDLFERFCLPSVKAQSCQNFKWLVLFDINTDPEFKARALRIHEEYPLFSPCYLDVNQYGGLTTVCTPVSVDSDESLQRITRDYVSDLICSMEENPACWHLTTRLDSDDALHRDMIKTVQTLFLECPSENAFDFVYSYKYIPAERIAYRYLLLNGHFLTLVEHPSQKFRSVLFYNHLHIDNFVSVRHLYGRPLQTELVHGRNVVNGYTDLSISGLLYAFFHFRGKNFGFGRVLYSRAKALIMIGSLMKRTFLQWLRKSNTY